LRGGLWTFLKLIFYIFIFYFSKCNFIILLKFGVYCHCFNSLGSKLSQLIVWEVNLSGSLRELNGLYPKK
jgi:hypothetical protein